MQKVIKNVREPLNNKGDIENKRGVLKQPPNKRTQPIKRIEAKKESKGAKRMDSEQVVKQQPSEQQQQQQQLVRSEAPMSFLGALVAQKALRRFLAPHKGLFSKLNLRRFSRFSLNVDGSYRLPIQLEPTYQLGPTKPFVPQKFVPLLREVVDGLIERIFKRPGSLDTATLVKNLVNDVRMAVKGIGTPRYKYVVHSIVTKNAGQSMLAASQCLWFPEFDGRFDIQQTRDDYIIHVSVFALYHD